MQNFRNKQLISYKFHTLVSSADEILKHPASASNCPFVQPVHPESLSSHLSYRLMVTGVQCLCSSHPFFYQKKFTDFTEYWTQSTRPVMLPVRICQREAINASFKWKGEHSQLNKERKKVRVLRVPRSLVRMNLLSMKLWRRKKKFQFYCCTSHYRSYSHSAW